MEQKPEFQIQTTVIAQEPIKTEIIVLNANDFVTLSDTKRDYKLAHYTISRDRITVCVIEPQRAMR